MSILRVHIDGENIVHGIFNRVSETKIEGKLVHFMYIFKEVEIRKIFDRKQHKK